MTEEVLRLNAALQEFAIQNSLLRDRCGSLAADVAQKSAECEALKKRVEELQGK